MRATTAAASAPATPSKNVFNGIQWRIMKSHCEGRPEEVTTEQARASLEGYYPDVKAALNHMWAGGRCRTAGHEYWIEKGKKDGK